MGYMIEIETKEMDKASEYAEKALKYMGKVMQCLTEWEDEGDYGERSGSSRGGSSSGGSYGSRYGMRSRYDNYGSRMGYRDEEEEWEDEDMMGERRRRSRRTGRYM